MKHLYKGIFAVLCLALVYSACKKLKPAPKTPVPIEQQVAGIIASDFPATMHGKHGGVNIGDGIKAPAIVLTSINRRHLIQNSNSLCGFTVDTTVNYETNSNGNVSDVKGSFYFQFTCSLGALYPDGYIVTDSLTNTGSTPTYSYVYQVGQHYVVQSLDPQDTLVSCNGAQKSYGHFKQLNVDTNVVVPTVEYQNYVLTNLVIDVPDSTDIISGTATFTSTGSSSFGTWDYTGTIEFIGEHMAIITINGKQYKANLITGTVTAI
jgi:hypothetical protein